MFLRSRKPYLTCITAICASAGFTGMLLFAGVAAACSGTPPTGCPGAPSVTTTSHGSVTSSSAYIYGDVDPNGCETTYEFRYRKSGGSWIGRGTYNVFGSGSQLESDFLSSLSPKTTYEYEITASSSGGTAPSGGIQSFTTPEEVVPPPSKPTVTNEAATGITSTGATLNASVNPNGSSTTYKF